MKPHHLITISIFILSTFPLQSTTSSNEKTRRILHQPLFPSTSTPPSPPPPPPQSPELPDQPFFHELPNQPTPDQSLLPPATKAVPVSNSVTTKSSNPTKKLPIVITSTVLTLGILTALAFYIHKRRKRNSSDTQKLVGSLRINHESRMPPPSNFLYIGTVEPSNRSITDEASTNANDSPYRKLNAGKRSDRYRPSPELQPLPPLTKPTLQRPPVIHSPPPMSSSDDDDSHDANFYTPQGSSMSYEESPSSRHSYMNNVISQVNQSRSDHRGGPHSKRTSSKSSRISASSPDIRTPVMIPSIVKHKSLPPAPPPPPAAITSSLGPLQPSTTHSYAGKRPKFAAPPPPLDMARLRLISGDDQVVSRTPTPPPPPPPPPGLTRTPVPVSKQMITPESKSPVAKVSVEVVKESPVEEVSAVEEKDGSKPKLKPLHWDKVRATSDRATVWDQLKSSSFQLNEDAMETLFGCSSANSVPKEATRKSLLPTFEQENRVLDPKKSQNIAILLRALNVTKEEVSEALLDGNLEGLGPELLETLVKMAPTKEEEIKLKEYNGESSKLGSAERFLKAILDVPFAFKRVEAMLYRANFDAEVKYLRNSFQILEEASGELKNSRLFLKLLEAVLRTGNRMNDGTNRGDARAFKLDTLLKLVDVKGTDGKTTLLHFVVQEIIRSSEAESDPTSEITQPDTTSFEFKEDEFKKQGLQVVSGLSIELENVKKAAGMDSDVLSGYVLKLETGLEKIRSVMQYKKQSTQCKFFDSMREFLMRAAEEIIRVKGEERKALSMVKEVTKYFHGDAAKEEAHPLRIFMIVRDFLSILDNVCRDVGRMQERATVGAGRSFRMPVTASLPVLNRYNVNRNRGSDDDSM